MNAWALSWRLCAFIVVLVKTSLLHFTEHDALWNMTCAIPYNPQSPTHSINFFLLDMVLQQGCRMPGEKRCISSTLQPLRAMTTLAVKRIGSWFDPSSTPKLQPLLARTKLISRCAYSLVVLHHQCSGYHASWLATCNVALMIVHSLPSKTRRIPRWVANVFPPVQARGRNHAQESFFHGTRSHGSRSEKNLLPCLCSPSRKNILMSRDVNYASSVSEVPGSVAFEPQGIYRSQSATMCTSWIKQKEPNSAGKGGNNDTFISSLRECIVAKRYLIPKQTMEGQCEDNVRINVYTWERRVAVLEHVHSKAEQQ